jgi:hypothetical protein
MMNVKEIIVTLRRVDVEGVFSSFLVLFFTSLVLISSGIYYFYVGRNYGEIEGLFYSPHLVSLQFSLTLLSIFSFWILKNKSISYTKPFNTCLFINILVTNFNLFVSLLLVLNGILFLF